MHLKIQAITQETFGRYGYVIDHDRGSERFQIICSDPQPTGGWQIAVNRIANRRVDQIVCHPNTMESFEPLEGIACLILAAPEAPGSLDVFLLDRPVCIHKGVWHATLTLSEVAFVKITENVTIESKMHDLPEPLTAAVVTGG